MSKAALMDLVWDFATTATPNDGDAAIMQTVRERRDIILTHRATPTRFARWSQP
jgi:hypothetical protein